MALITNAQFKKINYGGKGQFLSLKTILENHILVLRPVTGGRLIDNPTFLSGSPIMTSIYGLYRAIHVYKLSRNGTEQGLRTVSEGVTIQLSSYTSSPDYAITSFKYTPSFSSSSDRNKDTVMIGSLHIDTDQEGRILIFEETGSPLEINYIWIGGNPVQIGRFVNGWALGIDY
jgi:hypothetical protein